MSDFINQVLFVDADDVWAHIEPLKSATNPRGINVSSIGLINRLATATESLIVLSTSWRIDRSPHELIREHVKYGFREPLFHPTDLSTAWSYPPLSRSREIEEWLGRHKEVENYVAIDDLPLTVRSVQVDPQKGFTVADYNECCKLLNRPDALILEGTRCPMPQEPQSLPS